MPGRPNFFIVGAPKSGTTSLSVYLGQHPNVFFCSPKEPYYFASDFPRHRVADNLTDYLSLFSAATAEHQAIGEGSVGYMYSADAIPRIMEFNRRAKLIVMLRSPIDIAHAMHSQALFDADEDVEDFRTAWNLQSEREHGRKVPQNCRNVKVVLYKKLASIGEQLERLYKLVPRQQVSVVALDDFIASPQTVYENLCEFLEIPPDGRTEFVPVNESKRNRFRSLGRFAGRPPQYLVRGAQFVKKMLGIERLGIIDAIQRLNVVKCRRPALTPDFHAQLADEFRDDVAKLSAVLQRDFSAWVRVRSRAA
ncbi:MAG: sulfotransferase [Planctomycetota bacterium]